MVLALGGIAAGCGDDDEGTTPPAAEGDARGGEIALLLPATKTTRHESADRPYFEQKVQELRPDCEIIYSNAGQVPAKQAQQAEPRSRTAPT
jgi:D-xylose transport system substrate-binding protein